VKLSLAVPLLATPFLAAPVLAQNVTEPKSGVSFPVKTDGMSLLGVGLRTKTMLKVKVYAIGLYIADSALSGPLAAHKGKTDSPAFTRDLVTGDFGKQIVLKFVRDLSADQIQGAFREVLTANPQKTELFVNYFGEITTRQEVVLRWAPGGTLEVNVAGLGKPPIEDKAFASSVFGIWLGDKPIQDDIKRALVSRAPELIK
jgi:hypothetical protein